MNKILILSHNKIGSKSNMGQTLDLLFSGIDDENLCQISFRKEKSSRRIPHLVMTDKDALKSIFTRNNKWKEGLTGETSNDLKVSELTKMNKSISKLIIRDMIWSLARKNTKKLDKFILENSVKSIVLFPGYSLFIYNIAIYISSKYNIKLVTYLVDDYYDSIGFSSNIMTNWFQRKLKTAINCVLLHSDEIVCITSSMTEKYSRLANKKVTTIYTPIDLEKVIAVPRMSNSISSESKQINIIYAGNLSLGRFDVLRTFSEHLKKIDDHSIVNLSIYGLAKKNIDIDLFNEEFPGIYKGFIEQNKLEDILKSSDVLLHVESFDLDIVKRIKHSFSTKLSTYIANMKPILIIGPSDVHAVSYFAGNKIGMIINNVNSFSISQLVDYIDKFDRYKHIEVLKSNHNISSVTTFFRNLLE